MKRETKALGRVLGRTDFRRLLVAQSGSALGDWLATVAFIALVFEITGSPAAVGGMLALRLMPAILVGPLVARAAHRWGPRRMMLSMNALRAGVAVVLPLVQTLWWVYLWAVVLEGAGLLFVPPRDASIRDLVDDGDLALANGLVLGSSYATLPIGAAAFAVVSAVASPLDALPGDRFAVAFWVDAATFLFSYVLIARITSFRESTVGEIGADRPRLQFRDTLWMPLVRAALPPVAAVALAAGTLFSLGIVFVIEVLGASEAEFGVLIILFGAGAAAGVGLLQVRHPGNRLLALRGGVTLLGGVLAVMSLAPNVGIAFVGAAAFGVAASYSIVAGMTGLQLELEEEERVLAFAAFHIAIRVAMVAGAVGAGLAAETLGPVEWPLLGTLEPTRAILFASGLLMLVGAWGLAVRSVRSPLASGDG